MLDIDLFSFFLFFLYIIATCTYELNWCLTRLGQSAKEADVERSSRGGMARSKRLGLRAC